MSNIISSSFSFFDFLILGITSINAYPNFEVSSFIFLIERSISSVSYQSPGSISKNLIYFFSDNFFMEDFMTILLILYLFPSKRLKFTIKSFLFFTRLELAEMTLKSI